MKLFPSGRLALIASTLAALLSACGNKSETPAGKSAANIPLPEPPCVVKCQPGAPGGRLVVATFGDPKTFNPITANESSSEQVYRFLFWGLVNFDWPTATPLPGLAESWSVEPDQKTWTFKLRRNSFWSDGQPLNADDVVFTWNDVIYNPDILNTTVDLFRIDKKNFQVTKVDDYTVRAVTPEVYAPMLEAFGSVPIIPKHILAPAVAEKRFPSAYGINSRPEMVVGAGPFKIKQFKPGQFTLLERNPYFLETDSQGQRLPYLDAIIYTVVPNQNAVSLQFLRGESDANEQVMPDEFEHYQTDAKKGRFNLLNLGLGPEVYFFWFNQNTNANPKTGKPYVDSKKLAWFRNQKFRQAVSYAVDRASIVKAVYNGRAQPNYGYVTSANPKWQNTNIMTYPYSLDKAHELLAEIGIKDRDAEGFLKDAAGNTIELVLNTNTGNPVRERTALMLLEDMKRLGFKVTFQAVEFNALLDRLHNSFDYDTALLSLGGSGIDPSGSLNVIKSDAFAHFWFPNQKDPSTDWEARLDYLMNAQIKTLDFSERKKSFDEVQSIMAEQMPFIYTVAPNSYAAIRADIGNVRPTVLSYYRVTWNAEELYFKKK